MLIYINSILCLAILVDVIVTIFRIMFIDKKIRQVFELSDIIKEKVAELKNADILEKPHIENIKNMVADLKLKQDILKFKLYKRIVRLKKSFPEMHSENLTKFMTQKISIESLKDKIKKHKEK